MGKAVDGDGSDGGGGGGKRGNKRIHGGNTGRLQVRAERPTDFTTAKRQIFLNTLAATCNVTTAKHAAGVSATTANRLRRESPDFARLWEDALDMGYRHLEEQLLARAIEGLDAMAIDPEAAHVPPLPPLADAPAAGRGAGLATGGPGGLSGRNLPVAYQLALLILNQRRAATANGPRNHRRKALSTAEVDALLAAKFERLDRRDAAAAARAGGRLIDDPAGPGDEA